MIDTNNSIGALSSKSTRGKPAASSGDSKSPISDAQTSKGAAGDQVVLSQEAQSVGRLQAKIATSSDVNLEKVAAIRQAIAEGKFDFNPERIAENMLNQEDLLG